MMSQAPPQPAREYAIPRLVLHSGARVHRWEEKAGFGFLFEYERADAGAVRRRRDCHAATSSTSRADGADGTLDWDVPAGNGPSCDWATR